MKALLLAAVAVVATAPPAAAIPVFAHIYAPLFTNPQTGDTDVSTRPGLAFVQAHAAPPGWLANLRLGLFELPVGTSPRVHRLTTRPYLVYSLTAFRLLGRSPPVTDGRTDTFQPGSTQIGTELSAQHAATGVEAAAGFDLGSSSQ